MGSSLDDRFKKLDVQRPLVHRALVLGGDSVFGGAVLREFASRGIHARGLRRWSSSTFCDPQGQVSWVVGDVWQARELAAAAAGCDVMVWAVPPTLGLFLTSCHHQQHETAKRTPRKRCPFH